MTVPETQDEVLGILRRVGSLTSDTHVVYRTFEHGETYAESEPMYADTTVMSRVGQMLATEYCGLPIDVVVTPPGAVAVLGHFTTFHYLTLSFGKMPRPLTYYTERGDGEDLVFPRQYRAGFAGKRVLIVNDVLIAGKLTRQLATLVRAAGGTIAGVGTMCNRGAVTAETLGIAEPEPDGSVPRFVTLASIPFQAWSAEQCELCRKRIPIRTDIGHGAAFLERQAAAGRDIDP